MHNLFTNLPPCPKQSESFETLLSCKNVTIERIVSASFHNGKWIKQEYDEWVVLLQGNAELEYAHRRITLCSGDYIFIPAHEEHRVLKTSDKALWLAVYITSSNDHPA